MVRHCLWKMCAIPGACSKPGLVRLSLCHKVNLLSCVARQPLSGHRVNLPSCVARRLLCHKVSSSAAVVPQSKSTEMGRSAAPFDLPCHDLWYFWHQTNEHFNSMSFIKKNLYSLLSLNGHLYKTRGGSRGRVQGVHTPPPWYDLRFSNTTGILQQKKLCGLLVLK